jgi:hypothetical protein
MASVSLTDFSSQQAEIERRRRLADLLAQQAAAPMDIQSYKGIQAPIPWTATLAKVLGNYAAAKQARDLQREESDTRRSAREEASRFLRDQAVDPGMQRLEDTLPAPGTLNAGTGSVLDRLRGAFGGRQGPVQPPQAPQGPAAPPQALAAALGAPAAPSATPIATPAPPTAPPQSPTPDPRALAAALDPQAVSPEAPPEMVRPTLDPSRPRPMAEQQSRLLEAAMSGNPYLEKLAPALYEHNQALADEEGKFGRTVAYDRLKREQALQDKLTFERLKPEDRTALQKDYDAAKGEGYKGSFMDWVAYAQPKFVSTSPGQPLFNARDPGMSPGGGAPTLSPEQLLGTVISAYPNARVTSQTRTPEQNQAANGVPNSAHLTGHAVDFTLGSEAEMEAAAQALNARGLPGVKAIYEGAGAKNSTGPHVHVQVTGEGGPGAPKPVAVGPQRPDSGGQFGYWALTPEEDAALNKAVGEGKVDLKGLNSRTAKITARAFLMNPGLNAVQLHAVAQVSANAAFQQRAKALEALPGSLSQVLDAGKKVNFSSLKPVGDMQAWIKTQTNNPDFRAYMAKRNDAVMRLAYAMRGAGMSDKATELEHQGAPVSMDPTAFDAWYRAQMDMVGNQLAVQSVFQVVGNGASAAAPPPASGGASWGKAVVVKP